MDIVPPTSNFCPTFPVAFPPGLRDPVVHGRRIFPDRVTWDKRPRLNASSPHRLESTATHGIQAAHGSHPGLGVDAHWGSGEAQLKSTTPWLRTISFTIRVSCSQKTIKLFDAGTRALGTNSPSAPRNAQASATSWERGYSFSRSR